jgi:hypothetical protein
MEVFENKLKDSCNAAFDFFRQVVNKPSGCNNTYIINKYSIK